MLHNETLNIWSHLIGFLFFSYFSVSVFNVSLIIHQTLFFVTDISLYTHTWHLQHHFPEATTSDRIIFATFCIAALKCLFCSSIYHTYVCHCKHKTLAATLDYIGIAFLIAASVLVTEYYGYYCQPVIRQRYMIFTGVVSSFGFVLPFFKVWDTKEFRPIRITFFLSLAFSSIVPVLHLVWLHGIAKTYQFMEPAAISVGMYLLGVLFCKLLSMSRMIQITHHDIRCQSISWTILSWSLWLCWYDQPCYLARVCLLWYLCKCYFWQLFGSLMTPWSLFSSIT